MQACVCVCEGEGRGEAGEREWYGSVNNVNDNVWRPRRSAAPDEEIRATVANRSQTPPATPRPVATLSRSANYTSTPPCPALLHFLASHIQIYAALVGTCRCLLLAPPVVAPLYVLLLLLLHCQ